jgi:TP901 family phage tail tape measure protein
MQLGDNDIVIYVGGNITDLQNKMRQAQGVTAATSASIAGTVGRMGGSIERTLKTTGNTIVGATGAASVAMVYPLTRIAGSIFEIGSELDSMSQKTVSVFDLMGRSVNDVKKDLEDFAFSLAGNAMFSANEIMESMYGMAQAGMQVEDIYTLMPEVINLATAQNMDLDTTFRMLYGTLQAYKLNASDATKVTHAMAASMSASVLDAEDLVYALKYINPTFAALGYSYNEGLTMIAMLRDLTFTGQNGGRILRDAFTDLIAPTSEAINIMRKWGISVYTNSDEINGLVAEYYSASEALDQMKSDTSASNEEIQKHKDFIIQLQGQMVGLDKSSEQYKSLKKALDEALYAERVMKNEVKKSSTEIDNQTAKVKALEKQVNDFSATGMKAPAEILNELWKAREAGMTEGEFSTVFGKQSYAAMMQLTRDKEKYAEVLEYVTYTEGEVNEAQRQSDIVTASTAASWTILTNHISSAAGEIYRSVAPALKVLFDSLNENFDGIKEFCILVAQNFVPILQDIANRVIGVVTWFNGLDEGTKNLIAKITAMGVAFTLIAVPLMLFTGIILWTLSPIVGFIGKIGLAVERIGILRAGMIAFNKDATIFGMNIMNIKGSLSSFLTTLTKGTSAKGITAVTGEIFSSTKALEALGSAGMMINPTLVTTAATTAGVGTATAGLGATIISTLGAILPPILIAVAAITALWFAWKNNWFGIRDITASVIEFITEHFKVFFEFIDSTFGVIFNSISNLIDAFINGDVNGLFSALGSLIGGIVRLTLGLPETFLKIGRQMIIDLIRGVIAEAPNTGPALIRWIVDGGIQEFCLAAIRAAVDAGIAFVKGFIDGIMGKAPEVKDKSKPTGKAVTDGIKEGAESGLSDVYKTMEDGAVKSANIFEQKFNDTFSKLDTKNLTEDELNNFKALELSRKVVDLTELTDDDKQFIGELQTLIEENGGEIPEKLKKKIDEQVKEQKPWSAFHEDFRKEFDLILHEWNAMSPQMAQEMKKGFKAAEPFVNLSDGLQDEEKQIIGFLESIASESGKLPDDLQNALNTKIKTKQPLDEWWGDYYQKWKDTDKLVDEKISEDLITKTVTLQVEVAMDDNIDVEDSAKETSESYVDNFIKTNNGVLGPFGLSAIIFSEIAKSVEKSGNVGKDAANAFANNYNKTLEEKEITLTIYPTSTFDNLDYSDFNPEDYDTSVTHTIDTTIEPTTDEEKKEQANTTSKEEGKELVNSYKEGVEEKKPELDATVETVKTTILDKLNLAEKAYDLGYTFVNSYTNGILAAIPALQSAINQMNGILNSVEAPPVSVTYNVSAAMVNFEGLPQLQGGGTTNNYDIDVNLNNATIRSEQDIDKLADAVYERISRNAGLTA